MSSGPRPTRFKPETTETPILLPEQNMDTAIDPARATPREITREEASEMARLAARLVEANARRSPSSEHATLGENDALFELHWRLTRLFKEVSGRG